MDQQIIDNNKLIAEFDGWKKSDLGPGIYTHTPTSTEIHSRYMFTIRKTFNYHKDWNWLMPVVEKIEALKVVKTFNIGYNKNHDLLNDVSIYTSTTKKLIISSLQEHKNSKIKATYFAIIEFIKWYNKERK